MSARSSILIAARAAVEAMLAHTPPTPSDEELAREYDRRRGYDRPRVERSKDAHAMAEDAPVLRWAPRTLHRA